MKRYAKNQKGVTLIELMVGMAILVVIMSIFANMYSVTFKSFFYHKEQGYNMQVANNVMKIINDEIKVAVAIQLPLRDKTESTEFIYQVKDEQSGNLLNRKVYVKNNQIIFENGKGNTLILARENVHKDSLIFQSTGDKTAKKMLIKTTIDFSSQSGKPNTVPNLNFKMKTMTLNDIPF